MKTLHQKDIGFLFYMRILTVDNIASDELNTLEKYNRI